MRIACLLPAAGTASRMGGSDKLLEMVAGKPCLVTLAERALAARLEVIVTLPSVDHARARALGKLDLCKVSVANAAEGMSASLKAGVAATAPEVGGVMILPADMPDITSDDMAAMARRFSETRPAILRARAASGAPGHPIIFAAELRDAFAQLSGDIGAQSIVQKHKSEITFMDFDDDRPLLDLDTREDWAAWRASLARK